MMYSPRGQRYGGREGSAPSRWYEGGRTPSDWRQPEDDPRIAGAEAAVGWLIDHAYFETVGLAPDGDLLLRLTEKGWETERLPAEEIGVRSRPNESRGGRPGEPPRGSRPIAPDGGGRPPRPQLPPLGEPLRPTVEQAATPAAAPSPSEAVQPPATAISAEAIAPTQARATAESSEPSGEGDVAARPSRTRARPRRRTTAPSSVTSSEESEQE